MSVLVLIVVLGVIFFILWLRDDNVLIDDQKDMPPFAYVDEISVKLEENIIVNGSVYEKTIIVDDYGDEITNSFSNKTTYTTKEKKVRVVNSRIIFKFEYKNIKYQFYKDFSEDEINIRMWLYQQEELKIFVADYSSVEFVCEDMKSPEYAFMFNYKGLITLNG